MNLYTIYDSKAEAHLGPYVFPTKAFAIRKFSEQVNTEGTDFNKWPGDYTLFEIATWNEHTGDIDLAEAKVSLGTGIEYASSPVRSE